MLSLCSPRRSPLVQVVARVLILALVTMMVPLEAGAFIPARTEKLTKSAFGELLAHTGSDPQPYAFAGEPYDPNSGFGYHRARWLDPRTGRFTGMDSWQGRVYDPSTLHRYTYASEDPANQVDPTGRFNLSVSLTLNVALTTINTISTIQVEGVNAALEGLLINAVIGAAIGGAGAGAVRLFRDLIKARKAVTTLKAVTAGNFRDNLARLTRINPGDAQAHHMLPQKFRAVFEKAALNIDDPIYGTWWEKTSHLTNASRYNGEWDDFLQVARNADEILDFSRQLATKYGIQAFF